MEFHALGRLAAYRNGDEVDLGTPKQKAVLAFLLINANRPVSVDRLLDAVWGDDGHGKENALRVYLSRLRSALEPERQRGESSLLANRGNAYQLTVDPDHFDVVQFEREAAEGRLLLKTDPAAAAKVLTSALSRWRGPAFDDFVYDDFAQVERMRLNEARVTAIEDRIEADLTLGLAGELLSELEVLRDEHPLRERLVSHQALSLYRAGRPADALRAIERFRRYVGEELGIDPSPQLLRLEEQVLLHDQSIQPRTPRGRSPLGQPEAANPFKGLLPFGPEDAEFFFGRDTLVAELLRMLGIGQRVVALVGASGSGKSSVVRAGLIPALAKGAIEGSDRWLVASMMPGSHPFAELEAALLHSVIDGPDSLDEQLRDGKAGLLRAALRILPTEGSRLLLIIDQFEELFTMVDGDAVRERFLSNLVTAVDDPHDRISVLVTLRADFYGLPLQHPEFGARLGTGVVNVTPMTVEELEAAALKPAERVGVGFEPALLGQLIADVGRQPGALPLFQYALTDLFDRRAGDTLLAATYRSMGGIEGALRRRATDLYQQLDSAHQEAARQLFLRLVSLTEQGQRSRRRVAARDVASLAGDTVTMHDVINLFGDHRLLSFDADPLTGAPTVELAHEALLGAWPTLEGWIDECREDLRRQTALAVAVREWQLADHDPNYLLPAVRLADYEEWCRSSRMALNSAEQAFLEAGRARADDESAADERRRQGEARSRRRLRLLVGTLAGTLGVVALVLLVVFLRGEDPTVTFFDSPSSAWDANIASGLERADRELDMSLVDVPWVVDPPAELRELAATAPEIVIMDEAATSLDPKVMEGFPEVRFGIIDGTAEGSNVTSAVFANEQGGFLAGAAAALKSETGIVGFIGATQLATVEQYRAGFEAGVRSVSPETIVLATFVDQTGETDGFSRPDFAEARAVALFQRGADVIFAAAGQSGLGVFRAADTQSAVVGRDLQVIGVDNDQWFEVPLEERSHVLTSIIKRGDLAAYELVEHMLSGGPPGVAVRLGLADGGFEYSTQGDGLTADMRARLDQIVADFGEGKIDAPSTPTGPLLTLDLDGNDVTDPEPVTYELPPGVDGFAQDALLAPGTYEVSALGTPFTITIAGDWFVQVNEPGHTVFSHPEAERMGDRDVVFLRPTLLADPTNPGASLDRQVWWPLDDIEGWLDKLVDGIVAAGPEQTEIGGRPAVYFEVEITNEDVCGTFGYCAGFIINTFYDVGGISGQSFERGFRHRVWWVDGGDEPPLVIIASTRSGDRSFEARADELLGSLVIGEPGPHPLAGD